MRSYLNEERQILKSLYGRHLSMTLIEYLEDINFLIGKNLRESLEENNIHDFAQDLRSINKDFSKLKEKYNTELRNIRNEASAHKSKDAKVLYQHYISPPIEDLVLVELSLEVSQLNTRLLNLSSSIVNRISKSIVENGS